MDSKDLAYFQQFAERASLEAGKVTLEHFRKEFLVEKKSDNSPVTIADRKCEEKLRTLIGKEFPDHAILGEEFGQSDKESPYRWILDPIDGTKCFIAGVPQYTVLVGLEIEGDSRVGVIHNPALERTLSASYGNGCRLNGQPVHVSNISSMAEASLLCSDYSGLFRRDPVLATQLLCGCRYTPGWGDAYGYSLVAEGVCDMMIDSALSIWDIAAVKICIEEAGGIFSGWNGEKSLQVRDGIAANPILHSLLLNTLKGGCACPGY